MTFLIFLIILGVLVFVHELGHFLAAKRAGVKVEEFGFGYPPRALKLGEKWGTLFTLNWIPFGGFVKIFGENYEDSSSSEAEKSTDISLLGNSSCSPQSGSQGIFQHPDSKNLSFTQVSKKWQAAILVAGVTFNILFAWLLFSLGFMIGLPTSVENDFGGVVKNPVLTITGLAADSPAQKLGLKTGDKIKNISLENGEILQTLNPENTSDFINKSSGEVRVEIDRGGKILDFKLTPKTGIVENKKVIGINMDMVGTLSLPIHKAIYEGGRATLRLSYLTVEGLLGLIKDAVRGRADISQVAGPVGIISLVGDASRLGFSYLLTFTALISINLAIINLIPFPALDGGRVLFVAIEGITKRKINPKIAGTLNTIGFALLIVVMLIVTYRDILRLF
jgi:regulator of sigma E protease